MAHSFKIQKAATVSGSGVDIAYPAIDSLVAPETPVGMIGTNFYGIVGGDINAIQTAYNSTVAVGAGASAAYPVLYVAININGTPENGYVVAQKGNGKCLVTGATSGLTAQCVLTNADITSLTAGQMSIGITDLSTVVYLKKFSNKFGVGYNGIKYFLNFFLDNPALSTVTQTTLTYTSDGTNFTMIWPVANPVFSPGDSVVISNCEIPGVDGTWVLSAATATSITFGYAFPAGPGVFGPQPLITKYGTPTAQTVIKSGLDARTSTDGTDKIPLVIAPNIP